MLDSYVDRSENATGPRLTSADITEANWLLIGHSHFDHLWGADVIAKNTGATIVGSYETIRVMRDLGVPRQQLMAVSGGETVELGPGLTAAVYPSLHSSSWIQMIDPPVDEELSGRMGVTHQERQRRSRTLAQILGPLAPPERAHLEQTFSLRPRGDGGPLVFLISTSEGRLLFQDTAGCWSGIFDGLRPDVAILSAAGRGNLDGEPWQGSLAGFIAMEAGLLHPRAIVPGHHDDWLPGFATASDIEPIREKLDEFNVPATVHELDYFMEWPLFSS